MSEVIGGIEIECPDCGASGVGHVGRYVWWVNQHGAKVRIFCNDCGLVVDKTIMKDMISVKRQSWKSPVFMKRVTHWIGSD